MRAYREANPSQGIQILTDAEFAQIQVANRSKDVLYVIGTVTSGDVTITDVYVGNNRQNVLVDNLGALVWVGNVDNTATPLAEITGFTNAAVPVANLV